MKYAFQRRKKSVQIIKWQEDWLQINHSTFVIENITNYHHNKLAAKLSNNPKLQEWSAKIVEMSFRPKGL